MNELLAWFQDTPLGDAIRATGVWSYGVINAAHIVGIATTFGAILVLDLRLLGWRRARGLKELAAATVPVAATGVVLALLSGVCLLATNGSEYQNNPFLMIKFAAIGAGLANLIALHWMRPWRELRAGREPEGAGDRKVLATCGGLSLASWLVAILAGRLMGYW